MANQVDARPGDPDPGTGPARIRRARTGRSRRRLLLLFVPAALAVASVGPVVLIEPAVSIAAYAPQGYAASSLSYWYPPAEFDAAAHRSRFNEDTLTVDATGDTVLVGGGFGGTGWVFSLTYAFDGSGPGGDAILGFDDDPNSPWTNLSGLKLLVRRDATGAVTAEPVIAVGTMPPYRVIPIKVGRHQLEVSSTWSEASVAIDGATVWTGDPGWTGFDGVYPVLRLAPGQHRLSVVPAVESGFPSEQPADRQAFRQAFVETALSRQASNGAFADDGREDAWTAIALIFGHRTTADPRVAAALDRWAAWRASGATSGRAWDGPTGPTSMRDNVGEPGIALAMWAADRNRSDWTAVVANKIEAASFTSCEAVAVDACRLRNLQPDGSLADGPADAAREVPVLQAAETAGFIAGADLGDRRAWIQSLVGRTYFRQQCQVVNILGSAAGETDLTPWSRASRAGHVQTMFLLALAHAARPDDPVWTDARVTEFIGCGMGLFRVQVGATIGWRGSSPVDGELAQEVAAARLFAPLPVPAVSSDRLDVALGTLIDPSTLTARGRWASEPSVGLRLAVLATILEVMATA
jgi:hypothetical protein